MTLEPFNTKVHQGSDPSYLEEPRCGGARHALQQALPHIFISLSRPPVFCVFFFFLTDTLVPSITSAEQSLRAV